LMDIDVLKVGNHGSRTSTSPAFLDVVRPEFGVISAGVGNQFVHPYHPHEEALEALSAATIQTLRTDTTVEPDGVTVTTSCDRYEFTKPLGFTKHLSARPERRSPPCLSHLSKTEAQATDDGHVGPGSVRCE
ncbi:MAG: hypothetical protein V3V86_06190, partial [Gammaproteobacteria bacterium]